MEIIEQSLVALRDIAQALRACRTPDQVAQEAVHLIQQHTGWVNTSLLRLEEAQGKVVVEATGGLYAFPPFWSVPVHACELAQPWRTGESLYLPNLVNHELQLQLPGIQSVLLVPLKLGERVQLVLCTGSEELDAFDSHAQHLAAAVSEMILLALQHVRVYGALERELIERHEVEDRLWSTIRKTETLYRVSRSLIGPRRFDEILHSVLSSIAGAIQSRLVMLLTFNQDSRQVRSFVLSGSDSPPPPAFEDILFGAIQQVCVEGWPLLLGREECAVRLPLRLLGLSEDETVSSAALVPLFSQNKVFGVLMALNTLGQRTLTQQDSDLLMAIAGQIVSAIQNAELFRAISEERGRLRALVESSRDGVVLLGMDQRVLVVNHPALRFLALPGEPEEWVDRSLRDALRTLRSHSPQLVKDALAEMRKLRDGDESPREGECQVGAHIIRWLHLPVNGQERSVGRLLVLRDVTQERLLEQLREDLTHTMVHDLRNPLAGISAALKLLYRNSSETLRPNQREILEIAIGSAQRMSSLVNAILDISRLESGNMPLDPTVFSLAEVVHAVLAVETSLAEQRDVSLRATLPEDLPLIWADRELIARVLENLISNAVKFTPPGGSAEITAVLDLDEAEKVWVSVIDTGPGIPPEIRERLFQKFVTGQHSGRGSGLGLAFCRMVLESHGERIWVSRTSEAGTTFTFTLPIATRMLL